MIRRVLVTGGTGFIGNYVIQDLLRRGLQVIVTSSSRFRAKNQVWFSKVEYIEHDIYQNCSQNLFHKFQAPDSVIHLAWGNLKDFKSQSHLDSELPNHLRFLKNLLEHGLKDLTCAGTCLEYGLQEGSLDEEKESKPILAYAKAKDLLRSELEKECLLHSCSLKWLRLFYMHGSGQNEKSILAALDRALDSHEKSFNMSAGEQVRDYLPVETVAGLINSCALQTYIEGIINVSSNQPTTVRALVESYLIKRDRQIHLNLGFYPYPEYEPFQFWGNNSKLKKIKK